MSSLRLATYNVHWWYGTDRRRSPKRIGEVIAALDADVVALQEVHVRDELDEQGNELTVAAAGLHALAAPARAGGGSWFGNALLTKTPVSDCQYVDLSVERREPRNALIARVDAAVPLVVVATHLGLFPGERRQQIALLSDALERFLQSDDLVVALLGDLNEWWPWGRISTTLKRSFACPASPPTFPSKRPLVALDKIYIRPHHALTSVQVYSTPCSRVASDHLPLVGVVENDSVAVPAAERR